MERETARKLLAAERLAADQVVMTQRAMLTGPQDEMSDELGPGEHDQADAASETYEREQALTILRLAEDRLVDIEAALDKVAAGTFGRCETCGDVIDDERLEARPDARFCEEHERDWELHRIGFLSPPMPASPPDVRDPGWRALDEVRDDEELDERQEERSAEEAAIHLIPGGRPYDGDIE